MARNFYVWDKESRKFVELGKRRSVDAPAVHQDSMDPLINHADGNVYDSKHKFRRATKRAGYIEAGNDLSPKERQRAEPVAVKEDISKVYEALRAQGNNPQAALEALSRKW